jgi:hypothetical protein
VSRKPRSKSKRRCTSCWRASKEIIGPCCFLQCYLPLTGVIYSHSYSMPWTSPVTTTSFATIECHEFKIVSKSSPTSIASRIHPTIDLFLSWHPIVNVDITSIQWKWHKWQILADKTKWTWPNPWKKCEILKFIGKTFHYLLVPFLHTSQHLIHLWWGKVLWVVCVVMPLPSSYWHVTTQNIVYKFKVVSPWIQHMQLERIFIYNITLTYKVNVRLN